MVKSRNVEKKIKRSHDRKNVTQEDVDRLRPVIGDKELNRVTKKGKTRAGQRYLNSLAPQVHEDTKQLLILKGHRTSARCLKILTALALLRKPHARYLNQRNQLRLREPLEDPSDFEYLGVKNHCSIFVMASSTKKHPTRLFAGRLFHDKLYDLLEFDVLDFKPLAIQKNGNSPAEGSKPLVVFQGVCWEVSPDMLQAKNYFADLFGGFVAEKVLLTGFDRAFVCTAYEAINEVTQKTEIHIRISQYYLQLKKDDSSAQLPDVTLEDIGPTFVLRLARTKLPEKNAVKAAMKIPSEEYAKKTKNISTNDLAERRAKIWINKEDISKLHTPHGH